MGSVFSKKITAIEAADEVARQQAKKHYNRHEKLMPNEQVLLQQGPSPIGTLTWIRGDLEKTSLVVQQRLRALCFKNPWLTGRIFTKRGANRQLEGYLAYPESLSSDENDNEQDYIEKLMIDPLFVKHTTSIDKSFHHEEEDFTEMARVLTEKSVLLKPKSDAEQPLIRVSIIPSNSDNLSGGGGNKEGIVFGVVVNMSHVAADGHTYYRIFNALMNETDLNNMPSIKVKRIDASESVKEVAMGGKQNIVFMKPGMIVSLLRGLIYDFFLWPFRKTNLQIEKRIVYVDPTKMEALKNDAITDDVPFVSTNDIIANWFLSNSAAHYGFMSFNLRNRLHGHENDNAGNYTELLYYRVPEDTSCPTLIRRSLYGLTRVVTANRKPTFYELATGNSSFITNWASFASGNINIPGQVLLKHFPMVDLAANVMPSTMAFCVIFQATANRLGVLYAGSTGRIKALERPPFAKMLD